MVLSPRRLASATRRVFRLGARNCPIEQFCSSTEAIGITRSRASVWPILGDSTTRSSRRSSWALVPGSPRGTTSARSVRLEPGASIVIRGASSPGFVAPIRASRLTWVGWNLARWRTRGRRNCVSTCTGFLCRSTATEPSRRLRGLFSHRRLPLKCRTTALHEEKVAVECRACPLARPGNPNRGNRTRVRTYRFQSFQPASTAASHHTGELSSRGVRPRETCRSSHQIRGPE